MRQYFSVIVLDGKYFTKSRSKQKHFLSGEIKSTKLKLKFPRYNGAQYDALRSEKMKVLEWEACQSTPRS